MQFVRSKLLLASGILALGAAGLARFTEAWTVVVGTITGLLFAITATSATGLRGRKQASAIAFFVVGGVYLLFIMCATRTAVFATPTNYLLAFAAQLFKIPIPTRNYPYLLNAGEFDIRTVVASAFDKENAEQPISRFFLIGHCIFSWLFAALAAWLAGLIHAANKAKSETC
jgi:hypothetical protein